MKIKNDLTTIKIGKKHYDFHNLILDEYLKTFANAQLNVNNVNNFNNIKNLEYLLIKFDTPFENLNEKSVIKNEDFDIALIFATSIIQNTNETSITTEYNYKTTSDVTILDYNKPNTEEKIYISDYTGKKITALGFNSYWTPSNFVENPVKAVLDTSNYNIYLQENQDFTVTRKDIITTDTLFYSNNKEKVPAPLHLMPVPNKAIITPTFLQKADSNARIYGKDESYGIIYSVGLSSHIDSIDKEFLVGQDIEIIQDETELKINDIENRLSKYINFPNSNLYPHSGLYPTQSNYKYIIIKYKVWQEILSGRYEEPVYTMTDTGYYYYQAIPATISGKLNLTIKYERG